MIKKVTPELKAQAEKMLASINPKDPAYKQAWTLSEIYALFGITAVWNERRRAMYFSLLLKDARATPDGVNIGAIMSVKPFKHAKDVVENVVSYRLGFMDYHRNNPEALAMIEI